ncbi:phosphoribosylformylglycinamidine synthase subunit PurQ [uncultured Tessaracoccus sp.]|uniref:phosphoribosylformylglycinamidine synthase subunit PurQ n=1 Tax=uncultured Tessaracoccus sp. TaxID=905023 RepID=UPI0025E8389B|nr:phosphoribosylformylglycinamidine synthase subunit PurQ [uncultured Tessaracoccus sp.]
MTRIGVVTFPGSLDDHDALRAVRLSGAEPVALWHASDSLDGVDAIVLPGGFSYGDYLRCGAIARFSPVMDLVIDAAGKGMPVLGICNGFQVLCEAHLLEGAMIRNAGQQFICRDERLRVETKDTVWTCLFDKGDEITIALKNGEGNFQATPETLHKLEDNDQVVFRYLDNPNGSANDIAGITNERGNVVGLMPHPEHNVEELTGASLDGRRFFESALAFLQR